MGLSSGKRIFKTTYADDPLRTSGLFRHSGTDMDRIRNLSVFISFLVVVPMIYGATLAGLENMDKKLLEMSQVFSMPFLKKVRFLFIPAVHPYLVSSCRTALGMSWKSGVAAEVIGIPKASIGEQLYYTKLYLDTSGLFAWTFSIILISAVFELVFLTLLKKYGTDMEQIIIKNLWKSYDSLTVLKNVDLTLDRDQTYCLMSLQEQERPLYSAFLWG